jgi:hypothetical protein
LREGYIAISSRGRSITEQGLKTLGAINNVKDTLKIKE